MNALDNNPKMNSKSAEIAFIFVIILVLSILLLLGTVSFASNLFRLTDASQNSFYEFVGELKEADSQIDVFSLRLDKETAVVFYNKGDDKTTVPVNDIKVRTDGQLGNIESVVASIYKPDSCQKQSSCICLCNKVTQDDDYYYHCEKNKCVRIDKDFTGACPSDTERTCDNGIILERGILDNKDIPAFMTVYYRLEGDKLGIYTVNPDKSFQ